MVVRPGFVAYLAGQHPDFPSFVDPVPENQCLLCSFGVVDGFVLLVRFGRELDAVVYAGVQFSLVRFPVGHLLRVLALSVRLALIERTVNYLVPALLATRIFSCSAHHHLRWMAVVIYYII